jgi:tetratricopeptide (TPR) repeat protein
VRKPQVITISVGFVLLMLLFILGRTIPANHPPNVVLVQNAENQKIISSLSTDSLLQISKKLLPENVVQRLAAIEQTANTTSTKEQKISTYSRLIRFWSDSAGVFLPFAWYTSEKARLENSEKSLTFAAHLFLDRVEQERNEKLKRWYAIQAKDLFERSLIINPNNDSSRVGLGATYLFGNISASPMEGIAKIKEVLDKDSTNTYAQITLAIGSLMSGQTDKAGERLGAVLRLQPNNLQAILLMAELYDREGNKADAIKWYTQAAQNTNRPELKNELEKRINDLKK